MSNGGAEALPGGAATFRPRGLLPRAVHGSSARGVGVAISPKSMCACGGHAFAPQLQTQVQSHKMKIAC